jgi:lipoprotein-anchoring transpeptidase ErfK/SrfK
MLFAFNVLQQFYNDTRSGLHMNIIDRVGCGFAVAVLAACGGTDREVVAEPAQEMRGGDANVHWDREQLSAEEMERNRLDMSWRQVVHIDTVLDTAPSPNLETWDDISVENVARWPMHLPLGDDIAGPSVLRTQILLDRALFSPGMIDGRWGTNTEKAIYWFQTREGLPATGQLNEQTFERLVQVAGNPQQLVREHRLTEEDVEGPFTPIPDDIYDQAKLDCSCYEDLAEKLTERFHASADLLRKLNPGVDLNSFAAGQTLTVPNVREANAAENLIVARLVVSDRGRYVHALDGNGRIMFHFPATLGSSYDPSPTGDFRVTSITEDPWWHYQPRILAHVDSNKPDARIPPGPNNAVGVVWMALNVPHYGIHGTSSPQTIGYASSAGCVRLTNWDALFLSRRIEDGIRVEFQDT